MNWLRWLRMGWAVAEAVERLKILFVGTTLVDSVVVYAILEPAVGLFEVAAGLKVSRKLLDRVVRAAVTAWQQLKQEEMVARKV